MKCKVVVGRVERRKGIVVSRLLTTSGKEDEAKEKEYVDIWDVETTPHH